MQIAAENFEPQPKDQGHESFLTRNQRQNAKIYSEAKFHKRERELCLAKKFDNFKGNPKFVFEADSPCQS